MDRIIARIRRALAFHGVGGVLRLSFILLLRLATGPRGVKTTASEYVNHDLEFDRKWGVETSGLVMTDREDAVGSNWVYGAKYQGCSAEALEDVLGDYGLDHPEYTFLDYGSGKGRALLAGC